MSLNTREIITELFAVKKDPRIGVKVQHPSKDNVTGKIIKGTKANKYLVKWNDGAQTEHHIHTLVKAGE